MTKLYEIIQLNSKLYAIDKEDDIIRENGEVKAIYFDAIGRADSVCLATRQHNLECKIVCPNVTFYEGHKRVAKIIASQDEKLGIALLPNIEEYNHRQLLKLAFEDFDSTDTKFMKGTDKIIAANDWVRGYKANKAKYTEEDMRKAWDAGYNKRCVQDEHYDKGQNDFETIIQSLSPIPKFVELEMEYVIEDFSGSMNVPTYADEATPIVKDGFVIVKQWIYEKTTNSPTTM